MYLVVNGFTGKSASTMSRTPVDPPLGDDAKVSDLRSRVAQMIHLPQDAFVLMHCGVILRDDDQLLSARKIRVSSSSIHVFPKAATPRKTNDQPKTKMTDEEMGQFMIAFGMAVRNPAFNRVVQRLKHRESLENLVAACPDLAQDPISCAFLSKPELLISLLDPDTLKYVSEKHPGLVEAANNLAAAVHEEKPPAVPETGPGQAEEPAGLFGYNLDMSDDDEEMETAVQQRNRPQNRSIITPDQLAAALASAQQGSLMGGMTGMLGSQPRPPVGAQGPALPPTVPGPSTSSLFSRPSTSSGGGFITQDQLAAALFAAMSQQSTPSKSSKATAAKPPQTSDADRQMALNLATMKDMGIVDEGLARKALTVMGGDLQAAIDLIFSGWLGEDD